MCSLRENVFDISAPLAVFNSSICSQTLLNDSNNNVCENFNIDEFSDEDILCIYRKNTKQDLLTQTLETGMRARFRWKKIFIIVIFVRSLQVRVKNRIPVITVTSTSTPSLSKWDQDMHMYHTPVHSEPRRVRNALVRAKKPKESVINFEGSFIICQSIGSASSFIRTPNMQLFNVDLKTPSSVGRNQEGLLLGKKNFKSVSFLSNPSTPVVGKGRNLLSAEHHRMRPSYSYSSIPYIDQEELDKIMKTEYNVHVINLCRIDDEDDCGFEEKPCHSCIGSLFFIFKSITSSLREYLVPLANKEKNI
ncbi:hypothetical protein BpHYR1_051942 [Brachionus plicatilis]|uniref:Uncharacterized protein n=1 Tax=Brachionus plicatilis TaxID=10195 RepID=A0A3M7R156_BRAPC|nr:hypothetical protein BpHYR1_051942 [Brachionus plicatilis]